MARKIDYNRGCMKKFDTSSGIAVYMYLDDPGVYLSAQATPIPAEIAGRAGFPVEEYGKQKLLKERLAGALEKITAELEIGEANKTIVVERAGFQLIDIGVGRHQVLAPGGDILTPTPLPLEQATLLFDQLVPEEAKVA